MAKFYKSKGDTYRPVKGGPNEMMFVGRNIDTGDDVVFYRPHELRWTEIESSEVDWDSMIPADESAWFARISQGLGGHWAKDYSQRTAIHSLINRIGWGEIVDDYYNPDSEFLKDGEMDLTLRLDYIRGWGLVNGEGTLCWLGDHIQKCTVRFKFLPNGRQIFKRLRHVWANYGIDVNIPTEDIWEYVINE